MRNVLLLGHHDVRLFLRDRTSYIWLFAVPLAFVIFMSMAARGPGGPEDARPTLLIDNRDAGFMGRVLLRELGQQGLTIVTPDKAGDARRGLTVPADFTERVLARQEVKLGFFVIEGSGQELAEIVRLRLWRTLVAMNARLAQHAMDRGGAAPTEEALVALIEAPEPVTLKSSHAGRKPRPVGFAFSLPGNLVAYLFMNLLIFGGTSVAEQRRTGVLRRTAINPVTRLELVFGRIYGLILLGAVQVAFFVLVGQFALGLDLLQNLAGIALTLIVFSWVGASIGVLIGFLIEGEDKVIGICLAIALPASAIGGCWFPLEVVPPVFRTLAHVVPAGWALDALHQLITFGSGFSAVLLPVGVLVLYGLVANLVAARFFRV